MARKMNERPKRVNVSARLDVWCSGLFIPLAKTQRRIIRNSRHVQFRPRLHSAPLHAGGPGMDPRRLLACNACSPTAVSLTGSSHPAKNDPPNASNKVIETLIPP